MSFEPWNVASLANLWGWYDATGGPVGVPLDSWADLSGNGRHLLATGSARPTSKTSGGGVVPDFDGVDDRMGCGPYAPAAASTLTFCGVVVLDVLKNYNFICAMSTVSPPVYPPDLVGFNMTTASIAGSGFSQVQAPDGLGVRWWSTNETKSLLQYSAGVPVLFCMRLAAVNPFSRINGADVWCGSMAGAGNFDPAATGDWYFTVGSSGLGGDWLNGCLRELLVFDDPAGVHHIWAEGYLADKHGVTLPAGHLFADGRPFQDAGIPPAAAGGVVVVE